MTLLVAGVQIYAQPSPRKVYEKAVDDINCTVIKMLLVSYDRPASARNITNCTHANIVRELGRVKENQVKGYRDMFLKLSNDIDGYKTAAEGNSVADYAGKLEEAADFALSQFRKTCQTHQSPDNKVCFRMEQKVLTLESDFNNIMSGAVGKMGGLDRPSQPPGEAPPTSQEQPQASGGDGGELALPAAPAQSKGVPFLAAIVLIALLAAVAWLFKEMMDVKEELADLKMLIKTLTQRKD